MIILEETKDIVLVDIFDNAIDQGYKMDVHKKGLLHRAFSVFIINNKDEMLLQKRAEGKYHSAGLWSNACCSHPDISSNLVEFASNRLFHEMGFCTDLEEIFTFIYREKFSDTLYEYEYDHVLLGYYTGDVFPHEEEASEIMWVPLDHLACSLIKNPHYYTAWFIIAAPKVIEYLKIR